MTVYADLDISGQGEQSFGGGRQINFALIHLSDPGPAARPIGLDIDHFLRIGYIAFGADSDAIDFPTSRTYWSAPIWIDFLNFLYHPVPTLQSPPVDFAFWASRVRWSLGPGAAGHLFVSGV